MKNPKLFLAVLSLGLLACPTTAQAQTQPQNQSFLQTMAPARTLVNRGRKAVWLTLSDRASQILLPAGWRITSRGFVHSQGGRRIGLFCHYLRPTSGRGGLLLTIAYGASDDLSRFVDAGRAQRLASDTAAGRNDALLFEAYRRFGGLHPRDIKRREANTRIWAITWGGLSGMSITTRDGTPLPPRRDELLNLEQRARYMITVASREKLYSVADSTRGQTSDVRSILASFRPR